MATRRNWGATTILGLSMALAAIGCGGPSVVDGDGFSTEAAGTGVSAEGYRMAHIHKSEVKDGVATMSPVDLVEIAPGQTVTFEHGGLHIMLMGPEGPVAMGEVVRLTLQFANGDTQLIEAPVKRLMHGAHGS